ncbi:hypothetical protein BD779DRAFT_1502465 [Infundibulicybe gibba]|nr:hypothetical protein BD779DRAFT_1502465 [Infundibulicybe gibba]
MLADDSANYTSTLTQPVTQSRKRKRGPGATATTAPHLHLRIQERECGWKHHRVVVLSSRPQLSISRGPVFISTAEGSEYFKTDLIGVNRVGFRYTQPCRTIESNPTTFRISWEDRRGTGLAGSTGFRSARCNAPMREGRWYMEVKILQGGGEHAAEDTRSEGSHVRVGYGYRDKTGDKVTLSRPRPYGRPFGSGDVVGMYIALPPRREADKKDPHDPAHIKRERQEVFEILEYSPSKEMATLMDYSGKSASSASVPSAPKNPQGQAAAGKANVPNLRPLPTLPGSCIAFFVNGECQGAAFQDIYDYLQLRQSDTSRKAKEKKRTREGVKEHRENPFDDGSLGYYPFISLFNDARVKLNPGPDFDYPPPPDIDALLAGDTADLENRERTWRPACDRYAEYTQEQWALDKIEEEEARLEAVRFASIDKAEARRGHSETSGDSRQRPGGALRRLPRNRSRLRPRPMIPRWGKPYSEYLCSRAPQRAEVLDWP